MIKFQDKSMPLFVLRPLLKNGLIFIHIIYMFILVALLLFFYMVIGNFFKSQNFLYDMSYLIQLIVIVILSFGSIRFVVLKFKKHEYTYKVYSDKLVRTRRVFRRTKDVATSYDNVKSIYYHQSFIQKYYNVGTIYLSPKSYRNNFMFIIATTCYGDVGKMCFLVDIENP